ncbi:glycosyltransferase family 4 protein [Lentisalinibacter sediminis]|uniref:glycosyltransferase family 4 protein n=1 Tax=Lentisalinibacter sediminis TaxID=2992237 RepID=UPI0038685C82
MFSARESTIYWVVFSWFKDFQFRVVRRVLASLLGGAGVIALNTGQKTRGVSWLLRASRYSDSRWFGRAISVAKKDIAIESAKLLPKAVDVDSLDGRCLVMAEPEMEAGYVVRKGVLLVSFTETAEKLYSTVDVAALSRRFYLVLEPSFAGYADPAIFCWMNVNEPVVVQATERYDRKLIDCLDCNLVAVPYGAGDWIDSEAFRPADHDRAEKRWDAVCVANYLWWKRPHAYFRAVAAALRELPDFRAALVLAGHGKNASSTRRIEAQIDFYGIGDSLDIFEAVTQTELRRIYASSRVLVFTSYKEGSSRVIYEAMASDTPVFVLEENVGVNKDYINNDTGRVLRERDLGKNLAAIRESERSFTPREWFLQNLGPVNTTAKLCEDLQRAHGIGGQFEKRVCIKANKPEAQLARDEQLKPLSFWMNEPLAEEGKDTVSDLALP